MAAKSVRKRKPRIKTLSLRKASAKEARAVQGGTEKRTVARYQLESAWPGK